MSGNLIWANATQVPLKDESVQLCCFSPPYLGLRAYKIKDVIFGGGDPGCEHEWGSATYQRRSNDSGNENRKQITNVGANKRENLVTYAFCSKCNAWRGQLGLEPSIDLFLDHMMLVMGEVWRILRNDGVVFVNIGDTYNSAPGGYYAGGSFDRPSRKFTRNMRQFLRPKSIKTKSLCLIPQKFAIRCQEAGWIVRSEIIWSKLNPMPESCKDRPTKAHEQVWMLAKQEKYFFDQEAVAQPQAEYERARRLREKKQGHKTVYALQADGKTGQAPQSASGVCKNVQARHELAEKGTRNIRTVWTLSSESCPEAHFATWPSKLVEIIIRAGSSPKACEVCGAPWERIAEKTFIPQEDVSPERGVRCCPGQKPLDETDNRGGSPRGSNQTKTLGWRPTCKCDCKGTGKCVVFDPFVGTATTVLVAEKLGRTGVGLDLSGEYLWDIAKGKIEAPMQKELF